MGISWLIVAFIWGAVAGMELLTWAIRKGWAEIESPRREGTDGDSSQGRQV